MSYALDSTQTNPRLRDTDYNHFVIFDPFNVIACHDFEVRLQRSCKPLSLGSVSAHSQSLSVLMYVKAAWVPATLLQGRHPILHLASSLSSSLHIQASGLQHLLRRPAAGIQQLKSKQIVRSRGF